jgi:hypothetical protein
MPITFGFLIDCWHFSACYRSGRGHAQVVPPGVGRSRKFERGGRVEITEVLLGPDTSPSAISEMVANEDRPVWSKWHEAFRVIAYPAYLKRTVRIALIFGSILFAINHLDEVVLGHANAFVWVKGALTYLVPFSVSNLGVLVASRRRGHGVGDGE